MKEYVNKCLFLPTWKYQVYEYYSIRYVVCVLIFRRQSTKKEFPNKHISESIIFKLVGCFVSPFLVHICLLFSYKSLISGPHWRVNSIKNEFHPSLARLVYHELYPEWEKKSRRGVYVSRLSFPFSVLPFPCFFFFLSLCPSIPYRSNMVSINFFEPLFIMLTLVIQPSTLQKRVATKWKKNLRSMSVKNDKIF